MWSFDQLVFNELRCAGSFFAFDDVNKLQPLCVLRAPRKDHYLKFRLTGSNNSSGKKPNHTENGFLSYYYTNMSNIKLAR